MTEFRTVAWVSSYSLATRHRDRLTQTHLLEPGSDDRLLCGRRVTAGAQRMARGQTGDCFTCMVEREVRDGDHDLQIGTREELPGIPTMKFGRCACGWRFPGRPVGNKAVREAHRRHVGEALAGRMAA